MMADDVSRVWRQRFTREVGRKWIDMLRETPAYRTDPKFRELQRALETHLEGVYKSMGELHENSVKDALTGLGNRRAFYTDLSRELSRASRATENRGVYPVSLIEADADDLKPVNDEGGHAAGDKYLRDIADVLRESVREADEAYRWGGDEFFIILPEASEQQGVDIMGRIQDKMKKEGVSVSQGMAIYDPSKDRAYDESTMAELTKKADDILYTVKRECKGGFRVYKD